MIEPAMKNNLIKLIYPIEFYNTIRNRDSKSTGLVFFQLNRRHGRLQFTVQFERCHNTPDKIPVPTVR